MSLVSGVVSVSQDLTTALDARRLTWPNGAIATTYSADEPERLRGPQHDAAWCDEIASWRYPEAWDHADVRRCLLLEATAATASRGTRMPMKRPRLAQFR